MFTEAEWSFIFRGMSVMEDVASLFQSDRRGPTPLVEAYLARVHSGVKDPAVLSHFGHWLTREQADELVALYDGDTVVSDTKDDILGALVAYPWASRDVRFAVLRKRLSTCVDFLWNFEYADADWRTFDDSQLLELIDGCNCILGHAAMAQELCRRSLEPAQLRAFVRDRVSSPAPLQFTEALQCAATLCTTQAF
jgi:hypothetical protein